MIFSSRAVADEWWRAVSNTDLIFVAESIKRITPQFYTHKTAQWGVWQFFDDARVRGISDRFRGKVFFQLENDRGGRGISIIPMHTIVDHTSGSWWVSLPNQYDQYCLSTYTRFSIRSKANASQYWYYDESSGNITVSSVHRSFFRISATDMDQGVIMIGTDNIDIVIQHHGSVVLRNVGPDANVLGTKGVTVKELYGDHFKFEDLDKGKFVPGTETDPNPLCYMPQDGVHSGWELAL